MSFARLEHAPCCATAPYGCINEVGLNLTWGDRLECASGQSGIWGGGYSGHTGWVAVGARRRRLLQRKIVFRKGPAPGHGGSYPRTLARDQLALRTRRSGCSRERGKSPQGFQRRRRETLEKAQGLDRSVSRATLDGWRRDWRGLLDEGAFSRHPKKGARGGKDPGRSLARRTIAAQLAGASRLSTHDAELSWLRNSPLQRRGRCAGRRQSRRKDRERHSCEGTAVRRSRGSAQEPAEADLRLVAAGAGSADGLIAAKHSRHRGKAAPRSHRDAPGKILQNPWPRLNFCGNIPFY